MSLAEIVFLGFIQGLTEFFPVSSSGHLVLFQNVFGISEPQILTDVLLHFGTLLSLLIFLWKDILRIFKSLGRFILGPKSTAADPNVKLALYLFVASLPAFILGYFFSDFFEALFGSLRGVGGALLLTGVFLLFTKFTKSGSRSSLIHALIIGILQGLSIVPGLSRSGLTIGGALYMGWERKESARFSFLLSVPAVFGATLYQLYKNDLPAQPWLVLTIGTFVSAVSGYLALVFLTRLVNKGRFYTFSFYCFIAGISALILSFVL